ncbi:MAG: hypothetical protein KTR15_04985 [Phycisphaeraceae bacterium]|nr:hypothetical protein [Phycisphaeraceae bacterium]
MTKGILYAATAALIGAVLWTTVSYLTEYEYDLAYVLVAMMVGLATRFGFDHEVGYPAMITAFVFTTLSISGGKLATLELFIDDFYGDAGWQQEAQRIAEDEEYTITFLADQVIREYKAQGKPANFPLLANQDNPGSSADYPTDVWNEAQQRWASMSEGEQQAFIDLTLDHNRAYFESVSEELREEASLGLFDRGTMLFIAVAGCLAAGITRVTAGQEQAAFEEDEQEQEEAEADSDRPV